MKRVRRGSWILGRADDYQALAGVVYRPAHNFELWIELFLEVLLPVVGIVVELVRWSFAKWMNVGYPLAAPLLWLGEAARWRHDPFFGVLLIIGVGMLTLAGLSHVVYQRTGAADQMGGADFH